MKHLSFIIIFALAFSTIFAQNTVDTDQMTRKERKEYKKAERDKEQRENLDTIREILDSRQWVLEADQIFDRYGRSYLTTPTLNFLMVDEEESAFQIAFPNRIGFNGVGGVTFEGRVTNYDLVEGKTPSLNLRFQGRGGLGNSTVTLTVSGSYRARAVIIGDFGGRITISGQLVPLSQSVIFKGNSFF